VLKRRAIGSDTQAVNSTPHSSPPNKRKELRFETHFDALYSTGAREGAGRLVNISYSGALLEGVSLRPEPGTSVRLYVFVQPVLPFELVGHVVRLTEDGFAIQYDVADGEMRRLVDEVAAVVSTFGAAAR